MKLECIELFVYIYYMYIYFMIVCFCILWVNVDLFFYCLRVWVVVDMLYYFYFMVICLVNMYYKVIDIFGLFVIFFLWLWLIFKYDNGLCIYMNFGYIELYMNILSYRNFWWDEVCIVCIFKKEIWFRKCFEYLNWSYNCIFYCFYNFILIFKFLLIFFLKKC